MRLFAGKALAEFQARLDANFGAYLAALPAPLLTGAAAVALQGYSEDQPRDERGRFGSGGGGGGGGAAKQAAPKAPAPKAPKQAAPAKPKGADKALEKAAAKVEKAKAAVAKARDGLLKAQKELKDLKAKVKAESPRARAAAAKAKAAKPVDVTAHVRATKDLQDRLLAGKEAKSPGGGETFRFTVPHGQYRKAIDDHVAALGKTLNKEQVLAVARGYGVSAAKTKAAALKAIDHKLEDARNVKARNYA